MKRSLAVFLVSILVSSCSVEPRAELINRTGMAIAARVPVSDRGQPAGLEDVPVAVGGSVKLGATQLPPEADFSVVACGCVYAYKLTSYDIERIKEAGARTYPIPFEIGSDMQIRLGPSKHLGVPDQATFGFPRKAVSRVCGATGRTP